MQDKVDTWDYAIDQLVDMAIRQESGITDIRLILGNPTIGREHRIAFKIAGERYPSGVWDAEVTINSEDHQIKNWVLYESNWWKSFTDLYSLVAFVSEPAASNTEVIQDKIDGALMHYSPDDRGDALLALLTFIRHGEHLVNPDYEALVRDLIPARYDADAWEKTILFVWAEYHGLIR